MQANRILPPRVTEESFDEALALCRQAIGADWVIVDSSSGLDAYNDQYSVFIDDFRPSAALAPQSVEEIQEILAIANKFKLPLWPVSTGRNFGYGGASPRMPGTIVLDLKRMNQILEVNEEQAFALVEPGVSYFDLYKHLKKLGSKLWIDPASPGWGSVLGNTLERGVGYTPYGNHLMMQCGMEVVRANGEVVRTGMGAMPNSKTWQHFKYGYGPYLDGMFTQSNYGIVTKMGAWLMPEPPGYFPFLLTFEREEDLEQIVEIMRPLKISSVFQNGIILANHMFDAATQVSKAKYYNGSGPMPLSAQKKMASDLGLGMWNLWGAFYGPQPLIDMLWTVVRDAYSAIPGAKFHTREDRAGDLNMEYRGKLMAGIPTMTEFGMLNWLPGAGHMSFVPVSPIRGEDAMIQHEAIRKTMGEYGFDYICEFAAGWRDMHHIVSIMYENGNHEQMTRARDLSKTLTEDTFKRGYGVYRSHLGFMDMVADQFSVNDHSMLGLQESIKEAVDPNGILAPGKSGIWPEKYKSIRDELKWD